MVFPSKNDESLLYSRPSHNLFRLQRVFLKHLPTQSSESYRRMAHPVFASNDLDESIHPRIFPLVVPVLR